MRIRTDQPEPVLTFETETDLLLLDYLPARQGDGPNFRLWEVAGTAHGDTYSLNIGFSDKGDTTAGAECLVIASPIPGFIDCGSPINSSQQHFVIKAAIAALDRWVRGEGAPPLTPRLEVIGTPPQFVLDDLGNVRGGIRSPAVDVPLAKLSGLGQTGSKFLRDLRHHGPVRRRRPWPRSTPSRRTTSTPSTPPPTAGCREGSSSPPTPR